MSFRTVGLFQPLPLQNNSHYTPSRVIIYAFGAPKSTWRIAHFPRKSVTEVIPQHIIVASPLQTTLVNKSETRQTLISQPAPV